MKASALSCLFADEEREEPVIGMQYTQYQRIIANSDHTQMAQL